MPTRSSSQFHPLFSSIESSLAISVRQARRLLILFHIAGLDAVAVAAVWQQAISRAAGVMPTAAERLTLILAVWCVYFLDRQLDAARLKSDSKATLRHRLHARLGTMGTSVFLVGLTLLAASISRLDVSVLKAGLGLASVTGAYLAIVQFRPSLLARGLKELTVGVVFACGCTIHIFAQSPNLGLAGPLVSTFLAAALFSLNCLLIGVWESHHDSAQSLPALPPQYRPTLRQVTIMLAFVALAWGFFGTLGERPARTALGISIAAAALLLRALDRIASTRYSTSIRIAADVVLLTPLALYSLS